MTKQTEANLISAVLHGLIVVAILSISRPEAARKTVLELDFRFMEPRQALASIPESRRWRRRQR